MCGYEYSATCLLASIGYVSVLYWAVTPSVGVLHGLFIISLSAGQAAVLAWYAGGSWPCGKFH